MKNYYILSFLLMNLSVANASTVASSTSLGTFKVDHHIYRCYGASQPTQQDTKTLTYTDWWRCDGTHVNNQFITCPAGYVSVGIYTWYYSDVWGRSISRCRAACAQVKAYIPVSNCRWENLATKA